MAAFACAVLAVPPACSAGMGPRDGTWSELPPPDVHEPLLSFVDPADGGLTVVMGYSGRVLQHFDLAGSRTWSVQTIESAPPSMIVSFGLVPDLARRRLLAVGMDWSGYETGIFGEVELWGLSLDPPRRWERIPTTGVGPGERFLAECAIDPETSMLYVVGGAVDYRNGPTYQRIDYGDTWRIDLDGDLHWEPFPLVGEPLPGTHSGGTFFAPKERRLVLVAAEDTLHVPLTSRRVRALDVDGTRAWSELAPVPAELPRYNAALGRFDSVEGRLRMIHWRSSNDDVDSLSLWSFDPAGAGTWSRVDYPPDAVFPVVDPAQVALDAAGQRLILFGGFERGASSALPNISHTDVWTGSLGGDLEWQRHYESVTGSSVRWIVPPVLDAQRRRVVGVSGYNTALFTYALDGPHAWTALAPQGPGPSPWREGALSLFDPAGDRLLVYGGWGTNHPAERDTFLRDLWELSFTFSPPRWRRIPDSPDAPRSVGSAAIHDPSRGRFIVFGGRAEPASNETWELDVRGYDPVWRRIVTRGIPPAGRWDLAAVRDARRDGMIIHGGQGGPPGSSTYLADTWFLSFVDCDAWVPLLANNAAPVGRAKPAAFYDPVEDRLVVLGGINASGIRFEAHALELVAGTPHWVDFLAQGLVPPAAAGASALYDAELDRVYLLGENHPIDGMFRVLDWDRVPGVPPPPPATSAGFRILGVGPNPSQGEVNIAFELPRMATVETRLYDARGRLVRDLGRALYEPGPHILCWDGRSAGGEKLRDGVYFARMIVEGKAISGKIVLMD